MLCYQYVPPSLSALTQNIIGVNSLRIGGINSINKYFYVNKYNAWDWYGFEQKSKLDKIILYRKHPRKSGLTAEITDISIIRYGTVEAFQILVKKMPVLS